MGETQENKVFKSADLERISEPYLLEKVLRGEALGDDFSDNKLLFIAIHAVFLESGFVGFKTVSGLRADLFRHLLLEQPFRTFTTSFWKIVKDWLVLPLLIDLCEKAALDLPPCLMRLPAELKLKILESLPGTDIARMACVCKEMQCLSSDNDLWKQKFGEEFGDGTRPQEMLNCKANFASSWENKKKRKRERLYFINNERPGPAIPRQNDSYPMGFPIRIVGGYYYQWPFGGFGW
ncbi:hypothetical protein RCOM_1382970 [Ricinus communis]|uniref:F-box domain-containing protein n=1 Tax=Ricinus communis TaxID=3988 RepID=B9S7Z3_RICCO|nr:hypothetical protein RCOM_1382970 [Ricinus communis]